MEFQYTKDQTIRGARPDAETSDEIYLIKNVTELRATYQVRMLAYMAFKKGKILVIELPIDSEIHSSLNELRTNSPNLIKIEQR